MLRIGPRDKSSVNYRLRLASIVTVVWLMVIFSEYNLVSRRILSIFPIRRTGVRHILVEAELLWPEPEFRRLNLTGGNLNDKESEQKYADAFFVKPYKTTMQLSTLPDLRGMKWPSVEVIKRPIGLTPDDDEEDSIRLQEIPFSPLITRGQRTLFLHLLHKFSNIMFENGLGDRFFIFAGALLGSFRHHDFIPWDDDLDIMVDVDVRPLVADLMRQLEPDYVFQQFYSQDKLFTRVMNGSDLWRDLPRSRPIPSASWGFPFLDIFYYTKTDTEVVQVFRPMNRFPLNVVFPLLFRPLAGSWFPAPFQPLTFLQLKYSLDSMCWSTSFVHSLEGPVRAVGVPCEQLGYRYAFVEHHYGCDGGGGGRTSEEGVMMTVEGLTTVEERLVVRVSETKNKTIHSLCFPMHISNVQ